MDKISKTNYVRQNAQDKTYRTKYVGQNMQDKTFRTKSINKPKPTGQEKRPQNRNLIDEMFRKTKNLYLDTIYNILKYKALRQTGKMDYDVFQHLCLYRKVLNS